MFHTFSNLIRFSQSNCDLQVIIDPYYAINYMAKYVTKSEVETPSYAQLVAATLGDEAQAGTAATHMRRAVMATQGHRDISAQETVALRNGDDLYSAPCSVEMILWKGDTRQV